MIKTFHIVCRSRISFLNNLPCIFAYVHDKKLPLWVYLRNFYVAKNVLKLYEQLICVKSHNFDLGGVVNEHIENLFKLCEIFQIDNFQNRFSQQNDVD